MQIKKFDWSKNRKFWGYQQLIRLLNSDKLFSVHRAQDLRSLQLSCNIYTESEWDLLECLTVYGSVSSIRAVLSRKSQESTICLGWMSQMIFRMCWNQVDNKTSHYIDHLVISGFSKQRNKQTKNPHSKSKSNKQTKSREDKRRIYLQIHFLMQVLTW